MGEQNKILTIEEARKKGYAVTSYSNGDYSYFIANERVEYLIRDGKELCKGEVVATFAGGYYAYEDENGEAYLFDKEGKKIA